MTELELSARAAVATDYIYRGTTLSDHGPAASASFEARFASLYTGATVATVKLPTQSLAEFTFAGGIRPKIAGIDFDIRMSYFAYPGEGLPGETNGTNYWETIIRGTKALANAEPAHIVGGFPLPAYLNWQAGVTFAYEAFRLDLRYYDTNLSKENCFVFTGDPNAQPGGRADPVTNPAGLVSNWCGATFVAKAWFAFN